MAVLRDMLNIGTQANLYNYVITDEAVVACFGNPNWGDTPPKYYYYNVSSTATDDGENVIKPTSVMGAGRYIKILPSQAVADWNQSDSAAMDYIKNKPTIPANTSDLTNDSGFISSLSSGDVNTALGYTPYNGSTNTLGFLDSLVSKSTSDLAEGSNLYYTSSRFNTAFSAKSTSDLAEGSNEYFTTSRARASVSAGNGISYNSSTGVISFSKRKETYSGTTDSSGNYTVTFGTSYSVAPNIQANIIGGSNTNIIKITSITTTGFTVNVVNRTDALGLLPTYSNVNGANVDCLIHEK